MTGSTGPSEAGSRVGAIDGFRRGRGRNVGLSLLMIWACISLTGLFAISAGTAGRNTLQITCFPMVPREGQPTLLRLTLTNVGISDEDYAFSVYVNGDLVAEGKASIPAQSSRDISYMAPANIPVGGSLKIYAEAQSLRSSKLYEEHVQIPPCPPEIWSSFSSFASFSTSLLGFISSFSYYMSFSAEGTVLGPFSAGAVVTLALLGVLVFLQAFDPSWRRLGVRTLSLRTRYGWLAVALLAIFASMIFTRMVLIIAGIG